MSEHPEVSVVVPCHDAARTLGLQLAALAGQRTTVDHEVIVVDNRSIDQSVDVVHEWQSRLPALRLESAPERAGAGYARNVGVAVAHGSKVLFCDADDVVAPDWIAAGAAALDRVELACGVDITLPDAAFTDVDAIWTQHFPAEGRGDVEKRHAPSAYPILLGGNLAVRKDTYLELGGYDVSMTLGNEDNDLAVRSERAGHLVHRAPAMRIAIRQRADLRGFYRRARVAGRGHVQLCERHDLYAVSPHLRGNAWRLDLPRSLGAAAVMMSRPEPQRDWPAVATRVGAAIGLWEGRVDSLHRRFPAPAPGVGLGELGRGSE